MFLPRLRDLDDSVVSNKTFDAATPLRAVLPRLCIMPDRSQAGGYKI
jgi:hypothetical protein